MTWEPKNKTEDDDDGMLSDDEKEKESSDGSKLPSASDTFDPGHQRIKSELTNNKSDKELDMEEKLELERGGEPQNLLAIRGLPPYGAPSFSPHPSHAYNPYAHAHAHAHAQHQQQQQQQQQQAEQQSSGIYYNAGGYGQTPGGGGGAQEASDYSALQKNQLSRDCGIPVPASKPKIWSVADTVACKTPPPTAYLGQNFYPPAGQQQQQQQQQQQLPADSPSSQLHTEQQQHHQHPMGNNSNNNMTMTGQQVELGSPLSMMSSYAAASPYSRIPTVYTEAMGMHIGSGSGPKTSMHHRDHLHTSSSQAPPYHQQTNSRVVGFTEIQPDTPPQTPPNMKLISHINSSSSSSGSSSTAHSGTVPVTSMGSMLYNNNIYGNYLSSGRSNS